MKFFTRIKMISNSPDDIPEGMGNLTPKYRKILDAAIGIDRQHYEKLQQQVELLDRNYRINLEFHGRPQGVTIAEAKRKLSAKYHTSESNIERIAYDL